MNDYPKKVMNTRERGGMGSFSRDFVRGRSFLLGRLLVGSRFRMLQFILSLRHLNIEIKSLGHLVTHTALGLRVGLDR